MKRIYDVYRKGVYLEQIVIDLNDWTIIANDSLLRLKLALLYQEYPSYKIKESSNSDYSHQSVMTFSASPSEEKLEKLLEDLGVDSYRFELKGDKNALGRNRE